MRMVQGPNTKDTGVDVGASGWGMLYEQDADSQVNYITETYIRIHVTEVWLSDKSWRANIWIL